MLYNTTKGYNVLKFGSPFNHIPPIFFQVNDHSGEGRAPELVRVWTSPEPERGIRKGDYNPSLQFASENVAIYADGRGVLFVLQTGNRAAEKPAEWTTAFHDEVKAHLDRLLDPQY